MDKTKHKIVKNDVGSFIYQATYLILCLSLESVTEFAFFGPLKNFHSLYCFLDIYHHIQIKKLTEFAMFDVFISTRKSVTHKNVTHYTFCWTANQMIVM